MNMDYFLFFALIICCIISLNLYIKNYKLKRKNSKLEKQLTRNLTDFELLELIAKLYHKVDFEKVRPDQVELWVEFVFEKVLKKYLEEKI